MINWDEHSGSLEWQQLKASRTIAEELQYLRVMAQVVLKAEYPVESRHLFDGGAEDIGEEGK